ncbi:MAG: BamA/TamA family outer membrane protein [Gemmatimonadaceae bacterium]
MRPFAALGKHLSAAVLVLGALLANPTVAEIAAQKTAIAERDSIAKSKRPEVRELQIHGVHKLSVSDLRNALGTKASSCQSKLLKPICLITTSPSFFDHRYLDEGEFKKDMLRVLVFYYRAGFRDASVDSSVKYLGNNKIRITLNITEGPATIVDSTYLRGIGRALSRRDTSRIVRPSRGSPLNLLALDSSVMRIRERLSDRGYADAVLTPKTIVDDSARHAVVGITVTPNRIVTVGNIAIEGNKNVSEETIRNALNLSTGDVFSNAKIAASQRSLYESALFRRAVIDTAVRDSMASKVDSVKALMVSVVEAPFREASTSFGFTTADFVQAKGTFTNNYLMNRPLKLDASVTIGNLLAQQLTKSSAFVDITDIVKDNDLGRYYSPTYQAAVDLTQRWAGSPLNTVGVGLFVHRRSSPGVLIDRGYGANATFTRLVAPKVPLSLRYQFEVANVDAGDVYFCVNYGVCDSPTISALRGGQKLSPLTLAISIDRTDLQFSPTRGVLARAELEHASTYTGSDFRYNRASVEAAAYNKIGFLNAVGAVHVRAGWVAPLASTADALGVSGTDANGVAINNVLILHPSKRFYAGGSQSVRGFGENQLGPRVLTVSATTLATGAIVGKDTIPCTMPTPSAKCLAGLKDNDFQTRPLGGTTLLEGSVELRIPVTGSVTAALFVDAAILGNGTVSTITKGTGAFTPGFGARYQSPVGPIRIDLGIRPSLKTALPVITEVRDSTGGYKLVDLTNGSGCKNTTSVGCRVFPGPLSKQSFFNRITNRLTLHLSIGEAF